MKGEIFNFILHSDIGGGASVANETFLLIGIYYQYHDIN